MEIITVNDAADRAGISRQAIYKAILAKRLNAVKQLGKQGVKLDAKWESFPKNGKPKRKA